MKIYYSYWENGWRPEALNLDMWRLSVELAKKHYGKKNIYLITKTESAHLFKDFEFAEIITVLDKMPDFQKTWSLGKIYAFKEAAKNGPFVHLDSDVFLWEPLPESLLNSYVFAQSPDESIKRDNGLWGSPYDLGHIKNIYGKLPEDWQNVLDSQVDKTVINMGIFGGSNTKFISDYCDFVLEMILNPEFYDLWNGINKGEHITACLPCLIEQFNLKIFAEKKGVEVKFLLDDLNDKNKKSYLKYTHLMLLKSDKNIIKRVSERVNKKPYDLEVRKVRKKNW